MSKSFHHHLKHAFIPHSGNDHRPHALRSRSLRVYSAVILGVKLLVVVLVAVYPGASYVSNVTSQNVIQLTNQARTSAGLSALATNGLLVEAAQAKANDMIAHSYFAHTSPSNVTPWEWFKRAGYSYTFAGENLAKDFATAEDVVNAWIASPLHKKNIMNAKYRDIGVAVATGEVNGVTTIVVAQMFGTPYQSTFVSEPAGNSSNPPATSPEPSAPEPSPAPEPPAEPPIKPTIISPKTEATLNDSAPVISGTTSPNAAVVIRESDAIIAEGTADGDGAYALRPAKPLTDGAHSFVAIATTPSTDLTSAASEPIALLIDTTAPSVNREATVILPSWEAPSIYTVITDVSADPATVTAEYAGSAFPLTYGPLGYYGTVTTTTAAGRPSDTITVVAQDAVKNRQVTPILSTSYFNVDVLQPSRTLTADTLAVLVLYSKNFLLAFLIFLTLALTLQVFIRIRVQHHATIMYSLLLMYTIVVLLFV